MSNERTPETPHFGRIRCQCKELDAMQWFATRQEAEQWVVQQTQQHQHPYRQITSTIGSRPYTIEAPA